MNVKFTACLFDKKPVLLLLFGLFCLTFDHYLQASNGIRPLDVHSNTASPRIQMAILLDTSGSMEGLIDQARNQLWQAVNEFAKLKKGNKTPVLEVAVYEYGNDGLGSEIGYTRKVVGFTRELDRVSEALFSLTTNGGSEYCGYVIDKAVKNLQWSKSENDIKAIFIAGNEPFTQGPISYKSAIVAAKKYGIIVNTIHAGENQLGVQSGWKQGALMAGGNYMSIEHNHQVVHINAPQDKQLAELNEQLNKTYIPFGTNGKLGLERQQTQDSKSNSVSRGLLAKRVQSKASSMYDNSNWDLVDAVTTGSVNVKALKQDELPEPMKKMDKIEQTEYVYHQARERKEIQDKIMQLSRDRSMYVASKNRSTPKTTVSTLNEAITRAIKLQSEQKNFTQQSSN